MGHTEAGEPGSIIRTLLPRIDEVERNLGVLMSSSAQPQWRRRSAAYDVLSTLNESARLGRETAGGFPAPTFQPDGHIAGGQLEDQWFLMNLGDRIHGGLMRQGLLWPPPLERPPPAVTRDLFALWTEIGIRGIDATDFGLGARRPMPFITEGALGRACQTILDKSASLMALLLEDQAVEQIIVITVDAARPPGERGRPGRSRIASFVGGLALAIGLVQGPGAIHDFPNDVRELGGDLITVGRFVATGISIVAEGLANSLSIDPSIAMDDRMR